MNYYFFKSLIIVFLLVLYSTCKNSPARPEESDLICIGDYHSAYENDPFYYTVFREISFSYDVERVDSLLGDEINKKNIRQDTKELKKLYTIFFLLPELKHSSKKTPSYEKAATEMLFHEQESLVDWNLNYALFLYYHETGNGKQSMQLASKLQEKALQSSLVEYQALAFKAMGEAHELNGNYKYAIRHHFDAMSSIAKSHRTDIQIHVMGGISSFYENQLMVDKSLEYKKKQLDLMKPSNILDSLQFYHDQLEYQDLLSNSREDHLFDIPQVYKIIEFTKKNGCKRLYEYATAFLRTKLMDTDNLSALNDYFDSMDSIEMRDLRKNYPYLYYLIEAHNFESKNQIEEADNAYREALTLLDKDGSNNRKSYFHLKYGQFLDRNSKSNLAGKHFESAVAQAREAKNKDFELKASRAAELYYKKLNRLDKAYQHGSNYHNMVQENSVTARDKDVYRLEIETEQKILEEKRIMEEAYQKKLNQVQYNLIVILIFAVFIFLLISIKFKVPVWFIRVMGYISVIFLFEFCIIQIDHFVHEVTRHSPWKIFAIKVTLISIILPVHHFVEKRLIKFLIFRRNADGNLVHFNFDFFRRWFKKLDDPDDDH